MSNCLEIDLPLSAAQTLTRTEVEAAELSLLARDVVWAECRLYLRCEARILALMDCDAWFHNSPDQRLDVMRMAFKIERPVHLYLRLDPELLRLLPLPGPDVRTALQHFLSDPEKSRALLEQSSWWALEVWQEHRLHASIGGGIIKVGYRTMHAPVLDTFDGLRRRGPVTRVTLEALLENNLPRTWDENRASFFLEMSVGEERYGCELTPLDANGALNVTVVSSTRIDNSPSEEWLKSQNDTLTLGVLDLWQDRLRYRLSLAVSENLIHASWVLESLWTAVSLLHHHQCLLYRQDSGV